MEFQSSFAGCKSIDQQYEIRYINTCHPVITHNTGNATGINISAKYDSRVSWTWCCATLRTDCWSVNIQGDSGGGKVNVVGRDTVGQCEEKVRTNKQTHKQTN